MKADDAVLSPESRIRLRILKRASWTGITGNLFLSILKISTGIITGSTAVMGDGVDSLSDVATSLVTLYAVSVGVAPPDKEHPWGHSRMETIAAKTISLIIIVAGLQLLVLTSKKLLGDGASRIPGSLALWVTGASIAGKSILALVKARAARQTGSLMMRADAVNMRNDMLLSFAVLLGVILTRVFHTSLIDVIAGLGVSLWIIVSGIRIFLHTSSELMDGIDNPGVYRQVFEAVEQTAGVSNPHRVRIRGLNSFYVIDLDVEVDGEISVSESHVLACALEKEIRRRVKKVFDIMVHVEPAGVGYHLEGYGLAPSDVNDGDEA